MILYDENYNFIGMSNETLSYLGYEDLNDFSSQHSDFANLLVNKEGYIYKFQNFSWIDFILYSGSPNKSALLQLKSGEPIEIKLSVKEVHLLNTLGDSSKFYAVRILSENFVNIAAKTDASITKQSPAKNSFNLNSLMDETTPSQAKSMSIPDMPETEEEKQEDFVLNFPSSETLQESPERINLDLSQNEEENDFVAGQEEPHDTSGEETFKLNISESIFAQEEPQGNQDFTLNLLKDEEAMPAEEKPLSQDGAEEEIINLLKPTKPQDDASDFILKELPAQEETVLSEQNSQIDSNFRKAMPEQEEISEAGFTLKHVTMKEQTQESQAPIAIPEEEEKITLNFLKQEREEPVQSIQTEELEAPTVETQVNFLQPQEDIEEKTTQTPANKEQIIAQIQNDIKEIDGTDEKTLMSDALREEPLCNEDVEGYLFNKNEVKKEKKSFTKTLQSLFSESSQLVENHEDTDSDMEVFTQASAILKKEQSSQEEKKRFPSLASLGLSKAEEDDLISEFVHDTKANIRLFKDFFHSQNIDQAEYTLIKMQSSAKILNLNDIIHTLTEIKQSCASNDSQNIETLTATLEAQIKTLESYIERETV